jgi:hypothetical protein
MEAHGWDLPNEADVEPLIDRLSTLIGQVQQILSSQPMLSGPVRGRSSREAAEVVADEKTTALRAIFQTNLDLRRSIGQIASSTAAIRPKEKVPSNAPRDLMINVPSQPAA